MSLDPLIDKLLVTEEEITVCARHVLGIHVYNGLVRPVPSETLNSIIDQTIHRLPDYVDIHKMGDHFDVWTYIEENTNHFKLRAEPIVKRLIFEYNMFGDIPND